VTTEIRKDFDGNIDIHHLLDFITEYSLNKKAPALWVELEQITGIDYDSIKEEILMSSDGDFPEDEDSLYLWLGSVLIFDYIHQHERNKTLEYVRVHDMPAIVKKLSLIVSSLYLLSPAYVFPVTLNLFTKENIGECVDVAMRAYAEADVYAKALLCIAYMEIFDAVLYIECFEPGSKGSVPIEILTPKQQEFMKYIRTCGLKYNNNPDALQEVREIRLKEWKKEQSLQ
jgi:hypothetical protein